MTPKQVVSMYETACRHIAYEFIKKYLTDDETPIETIYYDWVGDSIGGVLDVNDYFFSVDAMLTALKLDIPENILFEWYETSITRSTHLNLEYYFRNPELR